ncbi:hypothetical protein KGA65_16845 [Ideonella sp. B7]|uniref:hypothetical protein n=1 Tax=Ideonella benzenivorans TaxID=2831643 RepID=UPI001CED3A6D|nr:hypothetical protein [Ideonella benzenivorans]MCA6218204.1 hypothetical protein [Ideonella benzenivorans]
MLFRRQAANPYRPTSRRQRLVIIAITAAVVVTLWMLLIERPGWKVQPIPGSPLAPCRTGQTTDCVGGQANVLLIPAGTAPGASGASAAR